MKSIKILLVACAFTTASSIGIIAQEHQHGNHPKAEMKKDSTKADDIVRKGVIILKSIDKNGDKKVYQDQMDWNVISDKSGKCPLCKMELKEVTIKEAKQNLEKHGFKVK